MSAQPGVNHCIVSSVLQKKGLGRKENETQRGRKSAVFWGSAILGRIPPGAMTAVEGGGFVSASVCACSEGGRVPS